MIRMRRPAAAGGIGRAGTFPRAQKRSRRGKGPRGGGEGRGGAGGPGCSRAAPPAGPPRGTGVHHYTFTLYALKADKLDLDPDKVSSAYVGYNLNGNAIAKATVTYTYGQ